VTDSTDRYFVRPADIPGCFVLWDRRSNSAVYGMGLATEFALEDCAQRLNNIYSQFLKGQGGTHKPEI
jgi:hypothetical protein